MLQQVRCLRSMEKMKKVPMVMMVLIVMSFAPGYGSETSVDAEIGMEPADVGAVVEMMIVKMREPVAPRVQEAACHRNGMARAWASRTG